MSFNPKTNWTPQDAPGPSDFNRIEQGIADATAAAEGAQAVADAAQETADEALNAAGAAQSAANAAQQTANTALSTAQAAGQAAANAQATADSATALAGIAADSGLVVEAVLPVEGAEPEQVLTAAGPAVQFSPGATQSVTFCRRWPFSGQALAMELVLAADKADAGVFAVQVGWQVNGGAFNTVTRTIAPGVHTNLYVADLGQIIPAASLPAGALVTLTLSRLGADAADTHPGALLVYHCRLKRG